LVFCFEDDVLLPEGWLLGGDGLLPSMALAKSGAPIAALRNRAAASKDDLCMVSSGLNGHCNNNTVSRHFILPFEGAITESSRR
jgi:hypothetical protein